MNGENILGQYRKANNFSSPTLINLNHDKGNLAIFCWTEKTQQLKKKNLIEAVWTSPQSGFNLKGVHDKNPRLENWPKK